MANYIQKLQDENAEHLGTLAEVTREIYAFRTYLQSSKFTGIEVNEGRKDWISTSEADAFATRLLSIARESFVRDSKSRRI